ncbi:MAG: hypothetical protein LW875_10925 [Proteobacteria bacterium]|nr:hypothetical protein [Pseudomonadota bacterium]
MKAGLTVITFLVSSQSLGAPLPASLSAQEILTLPAENRLLVARDHRNMLSQKLPEMAFDQNLSMPQRWRALALHTQLEGVKALPQVEKAIKSPEWFMRNAALLSLKSIAPERVEKFAFELLEDKALVVRSAAVGHLPENLSQAQREKLWDLMESKSNFRGLQSLWVRAEIFQKLVLKPQKRELPLYLKALREKDQRFHGPALKALQQMGPQVAKNSESMEVQRQKWLKWAATADLSRFN